MTTITKALQTLTNIADEYEISWPKTFGLYKVVEKRVQKYANKIRTEPPMKDNNNELIFNRYNNLRFMSQDDIYSKYIPVTSCEIIERYYRLNEFRKNYQRNNKNINNK